MAIDYFWETNYKFGMFLKKIFGEDKYKRKYSLEGNGIYNLLYINNKLYEVKYTECKKLLANDNKPLKDDKKFIIDTIVENLRDTDNSITVSGGKFITFKVGKWFAKAEIVQKRTEPK